MILEYRGIFTSREAGETTHHAVGTLSLELTKRLDLDVSFIWDRITNPTVGSDGVQPKPDDFRLVLGLGIDFSIHLVSRFYDKSSADKAQKEFDAVFKEGKKPVDIKTKKMSKAIWKAASLLNESGLVSTGSEARRIIKQGGFKVEGKTLLDENAEIDISKPVLLQKGKKDFIKVVKK